MKLKSGKIRHSIDSPLFYKTLANNTTRLMVSFTADKHQANETQQKVERKIGKSVKEKQ